jgi:hypothetical protein
LIRVERRKWLHTWLGDRTLFSDVTIYHLGSVVMLFIGVMQSGHIGIVCLCMTGQNSDSGTCENAAVCLKIVCNRVNYNNDL